MNQNLATHVFDQAIALESTGPDSFSGQSPSAYRNMVGPFGGIVAATLLNAVLSHRERHGDPIAMTVNFAGPIAGGDFQIVASVRRTSRSTQHWTVELGQEGAVAATATVMLGLRRDTWGDTESSMPEVPPASEISSLDTSQNWPWLHNYDFRIIEGAFDPEQLTQERKDSVTRLWVRDSPARPLDHLSLMALSDSFFPRTFVRLQKRMPVGTVSMTTYFHADQEGLARQGSAPLLGEARAHRYNRGFYDQTGKFWGAGGELLATTHQMVYFKD